MIKSQTKTISLTGARLLIEADHLPRRALKWRGAEHVPGGGHCSQYAITCVTGDAPARRETSNGSAQLCSDLASARQKKN
jgi:hypothetical protein